MEKQLTVKRDANRPRRAPLSGRNRLNIKNMDPNYHYRIVNANLENDPDRVQRLQEIGYEIVPGQETGGVGDKRVDNPSALGSAGQISVGQGTKAVVMRIPREYFLQDQAEKQKQVVDPRAEAKKSADYGDVDISSSRG